MQLQLISFAPRRHVRGLTLIELMISLALSGVLITGVFTLYLDSKKTDRVGTALARIQESGRFGTEFMAKDIRMTGYQGCASPGDVALNIIAKNPPTSNFAATSLRGFEVTNGNWATGTEFDNTAIEARARIGSDVIAIQRATSDNTQLVGNMATLNANIQINDNTMALKADDIIMISDCEYADLFRATNVSKGSGKVTIAHANSTNTTNKLSKLYNEDAKVLRFTSTVYFVADTGRRDIAGQPVYALYRQTDNMLTAGLSFTIEELVEGVESMQILYGERLANGNIRYVPANTAGLDFTRVVSVQMGLLVAHSDPVQDGYDTLNYPLPGQTITVEGSGDPVTHAKDKRVRRTFSATINIRNRS